MEKTNLSGPAHFEKVVDCQYACPAHTPVPEYIRMIANGDYTGAYLINWESNVFPGVLGRVCDRPCEPVCRRSRVESEPVAICRLKRVAADNTDDISAYLPKIPAEKNGFRVAMLGAGPASLTVARDLAPLGYQIDMYDREKKAGGFMRSQIPGFRLPETVLDKETDRVLNMGVSQIFNTEVTSLREMLSKNYDAVFVGTGAPLGRDIDIEGRKKADKTTFVGIQWLASVAFGHVKKVGKKVIVLGGGNTAMDCCRTALRLGGEKVSIVVRSSFEDMKASPWEKEDAMHEGVDIRSHHVPKRFVIEKDKLIGMEFELVTSVYDNAGRRTLEPTGEPDAFIPCDQVLVAIGQDTAFPWIERDLGIDFNKWDQPVLNSDTLQSTMEKVFFGGDAAYGPENIITAVAHGHKAAKGIHHFLSGEANSEQSFHLVSQKMGVHEWSYHSAINEAQRKVVPLADLKLSLANLRMEVELGFDIKTAREEAERCLNCDVHTVFTENKCIECNSCVDICPMDCINFLANDDEQALRLNLRVPAKNLTQDLLVSDSLKTGDIMVKDEDVCLHCGLCAERCPTNAWDMQKYIAESI